MGIQEVAVFGDAELIVQQIRNAYQAKHPRLRSYRNEVWDLIDSFISAFNISFIPREENTVANSLATSASILIRGSNFAQISKCSECNEINAIASISSS